MQVELGISVQNAVYFSLLWSTFPYTFSNSLNILPCINPWFFLKSFGMNYLNYLRKGSRKISNETMIHIRYFLSKLLSIFFSLSIVSDLFVSPNVYKFCEWRLCRVVCFSVFFYSIQDTGWLRLVWIHIL